MIRNVEIRRADEADAEGIAAVMARVSAERKYSAIDEPFSVEQEREYLRSLSDREPIHIAVADSCLIVGLQSLELWARSIHSMRHAGQIGTFLLPEWRRKGIGRTMFNTTETFARSAGYAKLIAQVRATNTAARSYYTGLGFQECGRLSRQVRIDGMEDDEILMERFLCPPK